MKKVTGILIILSWAAITNANDIDRLKTIKDVGQFLIKEIDTNDDIHSYGIVNFYKLDLDNNGLTDLIVDRNVCFIVLDMGNGQYEKRSIYAGKPYTVVNAIHWKGNPLLIVKSSDVHNNVRTYNLQNDTLTFKFGDFIEYNSNPDHLKVEEINFKSDGGSMIAGASFEMKIGQNRKMTYRKGKTVSTTIIDAAVFDKLIQTINYIKLDSLESGYSVEWTDDEDVELEVKFNNGKIKKIGDYGACGTFGLQNLYRQLFSLSRALNGIK